MSSAADHAISVAFTFFDEDGGGSVNLYEIQHVLNLFDSHFDKAGRDAIIQMMWVHTQSHYNLVARPTAIYLAVDLSPQRNDIDPQRIRSPPSERSSVVAGLTCHIVRP